MVLPVCAGVLFFPSADYSSSLENGVYLLIWLLYRGHGYALLGGGHTVKSLAPLTCRTRAHKGSLGGSLVRRNVGGAVVHL